MANKTKVKIDRVCPYTYQECYLKGMCVISDLDYGQRQKEAMTCKSRGDKIDKNGWIGKYKLVKARATNE